MEDTLRVYVQETIGGWKQVLILVLMEDTLRGQRGLSYVWYSKVLILVLMEDTLRGKNVTVLKNIATS